MLAKLTPETFPNRFTVASAATARKSMFIVFATGAFFHRGFGKSNRAVERQQPECFDFSNEIRKQSYPSHSSDSSDLSDPSDSSPFTPATSPPRSKTNPNAPAKSASPLSARAATSKSRNYSGRPLVPKHKFHDGES